jgi:DNA-binding beta-propeller fold protein YncE
MAEASPGMFIVRFLTSDGRPAGLGALVGPRQVITCAHVVNAALGLDRRSQGQPDESARIEFPLLSGTEAQPHTASVSMWRPPPAPAATTGDDITGLIVHGDLPAGAAPALLAADPPQPGTPVRVFGYPSAPARPEGGFVTAQIAGQVASGRLQLNSSDDSALRVQPGYSGSPVIDDAIGRIVGLIGLAPDAKSGDRDSYAIGPALLREAWPDVFGRSTRSPRTRTEPLSILHVSAPRFRSDVTEEQELFEQLRRDLATVADDHGLRPDVLVVTGDLADGGLPGEYRRAFDFLARLAGHAGIPRGHVVVVPGSHDVNRALCEAHFLMQEGLGQEPVPPYFPKWQPYAAALTEFYQGIPSIRFTADEPWTCFEMADLTLVVAGLNSTMARSHQAGDSRGELTQPQLDWFADRLPRLTQLGWRRLAAISDHVLRDGEALDEKVGQAGLLDLVLSGNADGPRRLPSGVPVLPVAAITGPASQYQVVTVSPGSITRHGRRRTGADWVADEATTEPTRPPTRQQASTTATTAGRDALVAGRDIYIGREPDARADRPDSLLDRVKEATRLRFPRAALSQHVRGDSRYLRVYEAPENGATDVRPVGVIDGPVTQDALAAFITDVHNQFAAADPGVRSELVYAGATASHDLVRTARQQGVRLRSFIDYQGLLDLTPLTERLRHTLANDRLYPGRLYVEQRYVIASGYGQQPPEVRSGLLVQAIDWLRVDTARLVVVLGDFGRGKTSFLRQLTRHLPTELPDLTPVLVELRHLEKGPTLDDLLAQHLVRQGVEDFSQAKLRYMIDKGRIALLFDGFDELELRVGYDSAADYLQSLLNSLTGQAKVVLTSRTQHFRSTSQVHAAVRTALGDRVEARTGSRVAILEDFTEDQILEFLTNLYDGDAARAHRRLDLIGHIAGLLDLTRNPRMLAFVAELTDERLLAVQTEGGELTAGGLYEEIIDYWLASEEQRQSHSRGLAALTKDERFGVCTNLALRMWRTNQPSISLRDLTEEVVSTLTRLSERGFTDAQAAHSIASGSLLVRTDDESFQFVHLSVMEWLVAAHAARELKENGASPVLHTREMSLLMAAFVTDLTDPEVAAEWAMRSSARSGVRVARQNALAIIARLNPALVRETPGDLDLSGVDLRTTDLTGRNLRGANLRGANLRGMRLTDVNLNGADLTNADLRNVVLTGGSLLGAKLADSKWDYAAILGTTGPVVPRMAKAAIARHDPSGVVLNAPRSRAKCIAFSPDGALLAYGSGNVAIIADATTGRTLRVLIGHQGTVSGVAFSPDGTRIATASHDHTARTWDATTGQPNLTLRHDNSVAAVAFSPDGTRIATASLDGTARTWDTTTGQHKHTLSGHNDTVNAVAFSPDAALLATASSDHTAWIWDLADARPQSLTYRLLRRHPVLPPSITLAGHQASVRAVEFHPEGTLLATASNDGTARVWSVRDGSTQAVLSGHAGPVTGVAYSPDGTILATSSGDGTVRFWDVAAAATVATLVPLPDGGYAIVLPDGSYKLDGDPGDRLWWAMKLCRFAPGELDPYVPEIRRLPADAPILPPRHASP